VLVIWWDCHGRHKQCGDDRIDDANGAVTPQPIARTWRPPQLPVHAARAAVSPVSPNLETRAPQTCRASCGAPLFGVSAPTRRKWRTSNFPASSLLGDCEILLDCVYERMTSLHDAAWGNGIATRGTWPTQLPHDSHERAAQLPGPGASPSPQPSLIYRGGRW